MKIFKPMIATVLGLSLLVSGTIPTSASQVKPKPIETKVKQEVQILSGTLEVSHIEGKHYELKTKDQTYVLVGKTSDFEKLKGQSVMVKGIVNKKSLSFYMRGDLLKVISIEKKPKIKKPKGHIPLKPTPIKKPKVSDPIKPITPKKQK